jgi:polyphosphate kinase
MKRNLDNRVETIVPILDPEIRLELDRLIDVYLADNSTVWDCGSDGKYVLRCPAVGEPRRAAQEIFADDSSDPAAAADLSSRAV